MKQRSAYVPRDAEQGMTPRPEDEAAVSRTRNTLRIETDLFGGGSSGCEGYKSPLMAFFDERRPLFTGNLPQPNAFFSTATTWVEKDAPGAFLVLDRNKNGKINEANALFGSELDGKSGFDFLQPLDKNKDGVIERKDLDFAKLQLGHDKNANGISEKSELKSLKAAKLISISLDVNRNEIRNYGNRAEAREWATFTFEEKTKTGKTVRKTGQMVDIWFRTTLPTISLSFHESKSLD